MEINEHIEDFVNVCHLIQSKGLVSGTGGNVSFRCGDKIYITPTGAALEEITPEKISIVSLEDGKPVNGLKPSKETMMHILCYRKRNDINAVVHVHSVYSVAIASMPEFLQCGKVPVYTPGYGLRVGSISVLPYKIPGSIDLAVEVSDSLENRNSALLANHGVVAIGKTAESALNLIEEIEENAKVYFITGGSANRLSQQQIDALNIYKQ